MCKAYFLPDGIHNFIASFPHQQWASLSNFHSYWCLILHSSIHLTVCVDRHLQDKSGNFFSSCHCTTRRWRVGKGCITTKAANMTILRRLWRWWRPWLPTACLVCALEDTTGGSRGLCTKLQSLTLACWRDPCSHTAISWNGKESASPKMLVGQKIWVLRQLCLERWTQDFKTGTSEDEDDWWYCSTVVVSSCICKDFSSQLLW